MHYKNLVKHKLTKSLKILFTLFTFFSTISLPASESYAGNALFNPQALEKALAYYDRIEKTGGLPAIPAGKTLKPGDWDKRIALIRELLAITGDLKDTDTKEPDYFDDNLKNALIAFQSRHGIEVDGNAGKKTINAMNVPVKDRIRQMRTNLKKILSLKDRLQWDFILVNIPSFSLYIVKDGFMSEMRVIVGKPDWPTGELSSKIEYIELNPSWHVPKSIALAEIIPDILKDADYLKKHNMALWDKHSDKQVTENIDWTKFDALGLEIVQSPGGDNPLGIMKFGFANPYGIIMHDTPFKKDFQRPNRAISHGCIRVERPMDIAKFLLEGEQVWSWERLDESLSIVKEKYIRLMKPAAYHIVYITSWADPDGTVHFRDDIYTKKDNKTY